MTDIKELSTPGTITVRGKEYTYNPVDGYGMALIDSTPNERMPMIRASCEVLARCLGITFDDVFGTKDKPGFSEEEIVYALNEAKGKVRRVEASVPPNSEAAAIDAAEVGG